MTNTGVSILLIILLLVECVCFKTNQHGFECFFLQFITDVRMDYRMSVILTLFKNQVTMGQEGEVYDEISPEYTPPLNTSVLGLRFCVVQLD